VKSGSSLAYDRVPKQHFLFVLGLFRPWQRQTQKNSFSLTKKPNIPGRNFAWLEIRKIAKHMGFSQFENIITSSERQASL